MNNRFALLKKMRLAEPSTVSKCERLIGVQMSQI
tara:strand:+ start:310 stop:411 length:102 start_codon:yes stop_codon:yes gene_type:complete